MVAPTTVPAVTPTMDPKGAQANFVRDQFVTLFLQQNKRAQTGLLLCGVLLFVLLSFRISGAFPYVWLTIVITVSGGRFALTDSFVRSGRSGPSRIAGLLLLNGVCLMLPVLAFAHFSDVDRAFVTIVLIATATASVATTRGYKVVFLWFATPLLLPLSAAWIFSIPSSDAQWVGRALGGLIAIYLLFLIGLGRDAFRVFDDSCRIRFAEQELNDRLGAALDEARQASQAKTRFLAAASHDLRQPLHTIGVLLAAMGLRKLDERSGEIVRLLGVVSQSLAVQLDGLLDVSKLDAGIVKPDLQAHRIDQIVAGHASALSAVALERGLYVKAHCAEGALALTDIDLFRRLLGNLTSNALKFTESGGIEIAVTKIDGHVVVDIRDTGIGIAPDQQHLIFQEFYQIGNRERDRSNGLGLGLAIVQRLCNLLRIDLRLESMLAHGSVFSLRLPIAQKPRNTRPSGSIVPPLDLPSLTVLVIDDEDDVRNGMRLLLEELGCRPLLADGTAQALEHAKANTIHMVISDLRLRQAENGLGAIQQVRAIHPNVYALLISGDTAPDRLQQAQAAGMPFLHKPVALNELLKHIHNARPCV